MPFWERFWNEYSKSTIVSGILALMIWGAIVYLAINAQEVPDVLAVAGGAIIVYFYKAKDDARAARLSAGLKD